MSESLQAIYQMLGRLHIYALESNSLIDHELAAYDAAFSALEQTLDEAARQTAIQTADGDALANFEHLVGLTPRLTLDLATRRSLVLYRLGSAPFDFHQLGMTNSIRATGMEAEIHEDFLGETMTVRCIRVIDQSLDLDALQNSVRTVLPAHLVCAFDLGHLTWAMFETPDLSWDDLETYSMSWIDFDLNGHNILPIETITDEGGALFYAQQQ